MVFMNEFITSLSLVVKIQKPHVFLFILWWFDLHLFVISFDEYLRSTIETCTFVHLVWSDYFVLNVN